MEQAKKQLDGSKRLKIEEAQKIIDDYEKGLTPKPLSAPKAAESKAGIEKTLISKSPEATAEPEVLKDISSAHSNQVQLKEVEQQKDDT